MKWQAIAQAAVAAAIGAAVFVAAPDLAPVRAVLCPPLAGGSLLAGPRAAEPAP